MQDLLGVRFEGEDNAAALPFSGLFDDLAQKILVGQVNPVKIPDGHDGACIPGGGFGPGPR